MDTLERQFTDFISRNRLLAGGERVLLAVSGGIDSIAMLSLFMKTEVELGIVHCNFGLRGEDADADEKFVRNFAAMQNLPFFVRHFDTEAYAGEFKLSIQEAARKLRYAYFEEIRQKNGYDHIAVAHNSDDAAETFLINLLRGTGIRGLTGIRMRSGRVIRPLLFASREMIEQYIRQHGISFRLDKSNLEIDYTRNFIRHEIIPRLVSLNPGFRNTLLGTITNLQGVAAIYDKQIRELSHEIIVETGPRTLIPIHKLKSHPMGMILLGEILHGFRFSSEQIGSVVRVLDGEPGKRFYSDAYRLLKDREELIIEPLPPESGTEEIYYLEQDEGFLSLPLKLEYSIVPISDLPPFSDNPATAFLDADKLDFPLMLRHWKHGDYFRPLGMDNMKKISDFFVNTKLSLFEKEDVWLLVSDARIAWVIGHRIDDRFKITDSTRNVLIINLLS